MDKSGQDGDSSPRFSGEAGASINNAPNNQESAGTNYQLPPTNSPKKNKLIWLIIGILVVIIGAGAFWLLTAKKNDSAAEKTNTTQAKTKITIATIWSDFQVNGVYKDGKLVSKGLKHYVEEYSKLHPDMAIQIQSNGFAEHHSKLSLGHQTGVVPDIYQINSHWAAVFAPKGMLAEPPADVVKDVTTNYVSTNSVTYDKKIWGIPTEVNDYVLLYNKRLFAEAGVTQAPKTWNELVETAVKTTKKEGGQITQPGFAFSKDDWELNGDPFVSLLMSNGGSFLSADGKKTLVNSPEALEVLKAQKQLFTRGATELNSNFYDFAKGKVAMVVAPPWVQHNFRQGFGDKFDAEVGLAPLPGFKKPATVQYGWFTGVMEKSKNKQEAWEFLKWFTSETQTATGTTRYGDLLANTIGAIPARKVDIEKQKALQSPFMQAYVQQLPNSYAIPNTAGYDDIRKALIAELQAAWVGQKTPEAALQDASTNIDKIISSYKE